MLPAKILATGLVIWFVLLSGIVLLRILRGDIGATGLLSNSVGTSGREIDPERVAVMAVLPFVLGYYVLQALGADVIGAGARPSMPDVPDFLVVLLTGSNGLYLAGKVARR